MRYVGNGFCGVVGTSEGPCSLVILAESGKPSRWLTSLRICCGLILLGGSVGIAPSLAVLLSYTRQQMSQPLTSEPGATHSGMGAEARATRKVRPLSFPAPRNTDSAVATLGQPEGIQPPTDSPAQTAPLRVQLQRRAAGARNSFIVVRRLLVNSLALTAAVQSGKQ